MSWDGGKGMSWDGGKGMSWDGGKGKGKGKGGKGAGASDDPAKAALVDQIKQAQRSDEATKQQWWTFCKDNGSESFDPNRHEVVFLETFLLSLQNGSLPNPSAVATNTDMSDVKATLADRVKEIQRSGEGNKQSWWTFCDQKGATNYDPRRHEESFLVEFFEQFDAGLLGGVSCVPVPSHMEKAARAPPPMKDVTDKVFVTNMPQGTDVELITQHFASFGGVKEVDLKHSDEGEFRGFGFVTFESAETARKVLESADAKIFGGVNIGVKPSKPEAQPAFSAGEPEAKGKSGGKGKDKGKGKGKKGGGDSWGKGGGDSWGMNPMMKGMNPMMMGMNPMMMNCMMMKGKMMKGMMGKGKMGGGGDGWDGGKGDGWGPY